MSNALDVGWVIRTGTQEEGRQVVVTNPPEVVQLVHELYQPGATEAHVTHRARPTFTAPTLSPDPIPDHEMFLQIHDDIGYVAYRGPNTVQDDPDADEPLFPVGSPSSPAFVSYSSLHEFPPGTGLPRALFTRVITEFLNTAELPGCVHWTGESSANIVHHAS